MDSMKCQTCRKNDVELLSYYERVKNWLFNQLFKQDIIDLSQDKYTQGFSDGFVGGRVAERKSMAKELKRMHNIDINE